MKQSRGARSALRWAAAAVLIYAVIGFLVLPPILRSQAERRLSEALGRRVSVGAVRLNPFMLSGTVTDFDIKEPSGDGSFVSWQRLYVRADLIASAFGEWVVGDVELDHFHASVAVNPDGSFNFSDLLAKVKAQAGAAGPAGPAAASRPVRVARLSVRDAVVGFTDRSLKHPFATTLGPLTFDLSQFRTVGSRGAPYHFEARTEAGESLAWSGTLSADPVASTGEFTLGDVQLAKYMPYLESRTGADLKAGTLSVHGSYVADFDPKDRRLSLGGAEVHMKGLKVVERGTGGEVLDLGALDVTGIDADAVALKAAVAKVALSWGHLSVRRAKDGKVNLLSLAPAQPAPAPSGGAPQALPRVMIGELSLSDFTVDVEDLAVPNPAHLSLGGLQVSLGNVTLDDGAVMPLHVSFEWAPKGAVLLDGTVRIRPELKADLKADVGDFSLLPLSPYLEQFVNARVAKGSVSTSVSVQASLPSGNPAVEAKGSFSLDGFGIVDAAHDRDLLGVGKFALTGFDVSTAPRLRASVAEVDVVGPYARVRVNEDGTLNVALLAKAGAAPAEGAPAGPAAGPLPDLRVDRVVVSGGQFVYSDHSIEPNVHFSLDSFGGKIEGLSSESPGRGTIDLKGLVGGAGPVSVSGKLDPLGARKRVDIKIGVGNADLVPLSPYSGKYAGYELARGQLVVDSSIHVDGDKLDTTNVVTLNQFTFGAPSGSHDATGLPVRLGVALLKDADGRIVIDLPVQGTLGDPNFRIGKVVVRVITNLLTKAAVSPFSLVGAMFGGGGEELAFQQFDPGASDLLASEAPKLDTLAKALANRPGLSLGIEGGVDKAADTYALKRVKLADLVRRRIWEARHAADPNTPAPDAMVVSPADEARMVKALFDAKFPPGTRFGTPLPPPPQVIPPPPGPPPGILKRIVDAITFRKQREDREARKAADLAAAEHERAVKVAVEAGLPPDEMRGRLAESIDVTAGDLAGLAAGRAKAVRDRLASHYSISGDRLFLVKSAAGPTAGPRVTLTLQ
jgi:hypothetical protein